MYFSSEMLSLECASGCWSYGRGDFGTGEELQSLAALTWSPGGRRSCDHSRAWGHEEAATALEAISQQYFSCGELSKNILFPWSICTFYTHKKLV